MSKIVMLPAATLLLGLAARNPDNPADRALGGAAVGGSVAGAPGAAVGAATGAGVGAATGALTTPPPTHY